LPNARKVEKMMNKLETKCILVYSFREAL